MAIAKGPIKIGNGNRVACLGNSIGYQGYCPFNLSYDGQWAKSTVIAENAYAYPKYFDLTQGMKNLRYKATTGGTTATTEPTWPLNAGETVTDGTVVWTSEVATTGLRTPGGYWDLAQALSGQRLDEVYLIGASSEQSPFIMSYVDRMNKDNVDVFYFGAIWENDLGNQNVSFRDLTDRFASFVATGDSLRRIGKRVFVQTVLPSGFYDSSVGSFGTYTSGTVTKEFHWLNASIRKFAKDRPDVILWDCSQLYIDPNPAKPVWPDNASVLVTQSGTGQQTKYTDGVHPNYVARFMLADSLANVLESKFSAIDHFSTANNQDFGVINTLNYGTSGTKGSGATGSVADSWSVSTALGSVVCSLEKRTDLNGYNEKHVITGAGTGIVSRNGSSTVDITPIKSNVLQLFTEIEIGASPSLLHSVASTFIFQSGAWSCACGLPSYSATVQDPLQTMTANRKFIFKTPPLVQSFSGAAQIQNAVSFRNAASVTVYYGRNCIKSKSITPLA